MVKVLENRAVDLDIAPGSKDPGELKDQADAIAYAHPPPCTIFKEQLDRTITDLSFYPSAVKQHKTSLPKPVSELKASHKVPLVLAQML